MERKVIAFLTFEGKERRKERLDRKTFHRSFLRSFDCKKEPIQTVG
jgi:hypothetical protein